jgi:CPA2 family monovalent cation:H+ antiporter-2
MAMPRRPGSWKRRAWRAHGFLSSRRPRAFRTRRIIELARTANPTIDTAVRTHSDAELAYLEGQGVGLAIVGARELSFGLARYALLRFGIPEKRANAVIQKKRVAGAGGAFERRSDPPGRDAPELRRN